MLFGIVFLWQLPHFLAIAWIYRDDYAARRLPDAAGDRTRRPQHRPAGVIYAAALVPVSLAPTLVGMTGTLYFIGAFILGLAFVGLAVRFGMTRRWSTRAGCSSGRSSICRCCGC